MKTTSGAGCVILSRRSGRILVCLRSQEAPQPGTWSVWGGKSEDNETPEETAIRETFEETGFKVEEPLEHLLTFDVPGFRFDTFIAVAEREFLPHLTRESDGFAWVPLEHVPEPLHKGLADIFESDHLTDRLASAIRRISGRPCGRHRSRE